MVPVRALLLAVAFVACSSSAPRQGGISSPLAQRDPTPPAALHAGPVRAAAPHDDDTDKDGITDSADACPKEPGVASTNAANNGCPQFIVLEESVDYILQQVHFRPGESTLLSDSLPIVDETAKVMQEQTQIARVEIGGHASSDEPTAKPLSIARARAVAARMLAQGIDEKRLAVCGYGASKPVDDNKTAEGRQNNRRVEFRILEQGAAAAEESKDCQHAAVRAP
jgi:outer membrane protein OmpA-like peptidoglycan-associated protein